MPPLSHRDTARVLSILRESDGRLLGAIADDFTAVLGGPQLFSSCCTLVLLVEDNQLLSLPQRLVAWFLVYSASAPATSAGATAGTAAENPFAPLLRKAALEPHVPLPERGFVSRLLAGPKAGAHAELRQLTAQQCVEQAASWQQHDASGGEHHTPSGSGAAASANRSSAASTSASATGTGGGRVSGSGSTRAPPPAQQQQQQVQQLHQQAAGPLPSLPGLLGPRGFEPAWHRPRPPLLAPPIDELKWINVDLHRELLWDSSMGEDTTRVRAVRELIGKALKGPLLPAQQQQVLHELEADGRLVYSVGLAPRHLPLLVENTPVIAYEVLLRLMGSSQIHAYLETLAHTEMSLHSMEVVNRLTTAVNLPTEFVCVYITNCINSCEGTQDKYVQNRLVRLVCVFLQSLIRNKIINIADLLHEVQAFCINFSRIREAAKLFRLLKQIEAGQRGSDGLGAATGAAGASGGSAAAATAGGSGIGSGSGGHGGFGAAPDSPGGGGAAGGSGGGSDDGDGEIS